MDQASDKESCNLHAEFSLASNVVTQVSAKQQVHDQIQIHSVLERIVHIHYELALDHR